MQSIEKYPHYFNSIKEVHENIQSIIPEIAGAYKNKYNLSFPVDINLIVGGFGSMHILIDKSFQILLLR